jgi:hypothetical protein
MKYYSIRKSLNSKIMGVCSQVQKAVYHCDVWDDYRFIDRINFINTDFEPITANAILMKKAKLTDLISADIIGFSLKLLVSGKLKSVLEKSRKSGLKFYKSPIIYAEKIIEDYWILNPYEINMEFIDFKNSDIFLMEGVFDKLQKIQILNLDDYESEKKRIEEMGYPNNISIEKIQLKNDITEDFFVLLNVEGYVKYIVSEKLKKEIEDAGCTGIEFQPIELSLNEWLAPGGEREKKYGKA